MRGTADQGTELRRGRGPVGRRTGIAVAMLLIATLLVGIPAPQEAGAASLPAGFTSTPVFTGLTLPMAVAFSPDGKVYVAEKGGKIKVFPNISSNSGTVFKDLSQRVYDFADRGLMSIEVDPRLGDGSGHDYVYALYAKDAPPGRTPPVWNDNCPNPPGADTDGCVVTGTLSRIPVNSNGTAGAEQILIDEEWCQQFSSHSLGDLSFGSDGYLYISGGEGASWTNWDNGQWGGKMNNTPTPVNPCGDPVGLGGALRSQSPRRPAGQPRVLGGALLRVDPDTGAGVPGNPDYSASNPSANASRIIAYGMRNPFRFTMRPGTAEVWVGDVGWGNWEEVNRLVNPNAAKATNFGWPCVEGTGGVGGYNGLDTCRTLYNEGSDVEPYFGYLHGDKQGSGDTCTLTNGDSVSGLAFYEGTNYPAAYRDALFVADNSRNCIYVMTKGSNGLPNTSTLTTFVDDSDNPYPVQLITEPLSKDILFVNIAFGTVNRIAYQSSNRPPVAAATATPTSGTAPLTVQLDASGSTDPDGDALAYSWDTDGDGIFGDATGVKPTVTYSSGGTFTARVLVSDPGGRSSTSPGVNITVANPQGPANTSPPTVSGSPTVGSTLSSTTGTWSGTAPIATARQWQRCDTTAGPCTNIASATAATYVPQVSDEGKHLRVRVTASNAGGTTTVHSSAAGPVTGSSTNTPPVPVITTPATTLKWAAGDDITFSGTATDAEDGTVPEARLSWRVIIGHCPSDGCHEHPWANRTGASGVIGGPDHEAPSYLQITLTATDAAGVSASTVRTIQPRSAKLTFTTSPPGLSVTAGSAQATGTPFSQAWVVGSQVQLDAPPEQVKNGKRYVFTGWSDGGAPTHVVDAPSTNRTYTATYVQATVPDGGNLEAITPNRVLDTRKAGQGPCLNGSRALRVAPTMGLPADATAVALNVTVTGARAPGYLTVYPNGAARPNASNLNFTAHQTVPNQVTAKVGKDGRIQLYASGGCPNVIVDITGYYSAGTTRPGGFVGITPTRALDTRKAGQSPCVSGSGRLVKVAPAPGVPANAAAVALNVTVTGARAPGYLTVYPEGAARPNASNLNYTAHQTVPNHVTAKVGKDGRIRVFASGGCPNVIVDIAGYYAAGTAEPGGFVGITPKRVLDTRNAGQGPCVNGARQVRVAPTTGVPADADAAVLNVTVVGSRSPGYLTVYPTGAARPTASNLNYLARQAIPNAVTSGLRDGKVTVYSSGGCPHVVIDVVGYHVHTPL